MNVPTGWTDCADDLPPEGEVVLTLSPGRMDQPLKRNGRLWFVDDGSMYVYYEPTAWRPLATGMVSL